MSVRRLPIRPLPRALAWALALSTCLSIWVALGSAFAEEAQKVLPPVSYSRDIKPIFSQRCYTCHGPDEQQRQAEMRLDIRDDAVDWVIVPGSAEESELVARIASEDPEEQMPPADSRKRALTPEEIKLVRRWIDSGAPYDAHWSYTRPERPTPPRVQDEAWSAGAIDHFVAARHEQHGYQVSPEADRRTLIRRLGFDLIGLPPTPEEVAAFAADESPDAYEKLVDRMLASPHFGERMAVYWLDQVRYADTEGIHSDFHREHDLYRDYVINAFNQNKPFDQFTIEQLAGDLLPGATREQKIASGFNRLNMTTAEGGAQAKEYRTKYAADRVRATSTIWLGATMGCAECHDHKFDPYTMKDFYSLASFFADVEEVAVGRQPATPLPTEEQVAEMAAIDRQIAAVREALQSIRADELAAAQTAWESEMREELVRWSVLRPIVAESRGGATLAVLDDGSVEASGERPDKDVYTLTLKTRLKGITALRIELLPSASLPARGPGRADNGNLVLSEIVLELQNRDGSLQKVELKNASATLEQGYDGREANPGGHFSAAEAIDGDAATPNSGWAIHGAIGRASAAVFETAHDVGPGGETTLRVELHQNYGSRHTLGRLRIAATNVPRPVKALQIPENLAAILIKPADERSEDDGRQLAEHFRSISPHLDAERRKIPELEKRKEAIRQAAPKLLITTSIEPRVMRILPRGNWLDDSGEVVTPAVPAFLGTLDVADRRATRLDLARWLVAPENPIVARVAVNRLWKICFGEGLVRTPDDFGAQGALPTHSRLLDWLAAECIASGWDIKHMLKRIVMSATYRQSSFADAEMLKRDPTNLMLARQNRFRLDAELVRDNALAISGLLVRKLGGPSVKPYQPKAYWAHLNFPKRVYQHDRGPNQYRRGLYTYWCRTFLHPSLAAFDAPSREECTVQRPRSNTPLQALVLLNDPAYVEAARVLAQRILAEGGSDASQRLSFAFQQALSRDPKPDEVGILTAMYEKHRAEYASDRESAQQAVAVGENGDHADFDAAELATWTSVARVILNLHETITRY